MKKLSLFIILLLALLTLLCSCAVTVEYKAGEGGRIIGQTTQAGDEGDILEGVTAVPDEGYIFAGWDDGVTTPERQDTVSEDKAYTAIFKKLHTVTHSCNTALGSLEGELEQVIVDGESASTVTAIPKWGYKFVAWSNGEVSASITVSPTEDTELVAIFAEDAYELPIISISTADGAPITSKDVYLECEVSISNTDDQYEIDTLGAKIRGRGNTSWGMPKKPYKLKLDSAKSLFGNGKAKDWTLIANYCDKSLIRNYLAYSVASEFSTLHETTESQLVELYLNNEYMGVYLLCESVEAGNTQVDIDENISKVDTGYLIELDGRKDGNWFTVDSHSYVMKFPKIDDALYTEAHKTFISDYLTKCMSTIKTGTYAEIEELVDTESFAQAYIVLELFKSPDVGWTSFFMHKEAGGKLYCGPVWDFDISVGNIDYQENARKHDSLWARDVNPWFWFLLQHEEFYQLVCETLAEYKPIIESALDNCYDYVYQCSDSFERNFEKWDILEIYVWPNPTEILEIKTWSGQVEYTRTYLKNSLEYMLERYPSS